MADNVDSQTREATSFSLMLLPDEIKLRIIAEIDIDVHNTLLVLRQVHPWFRESISKEIMRHRLLAAEASLSTFGDKASKLVCYTCLKVLPKHAFSDRSRVAPRGLGGVDAHKRFCVGCGVLRKIYDHGTYLVIDKQPASVCTFCQELFQGQDLDRMDRERMRREGRNYCCEHGKSSQASLKEQDYFVKRESYRASQAGKARRAECSAYSEGPYWSNDDDDGHRSDASSL